MQATLRPALGLAIGLAIGLAAAPAGAQPEKFSLSMFHFNVQYVAGGLQGYPSGTDDNPDYDLDDAAVQDLIIVESFEPVLDLFLAHPGWKVTLEMQAYMVEIMAERHPDVLAKLETLIQAGQAELVSFHWSDQLFLAYPRRDLEVSHAIMDEVFSRVGFEPSPVVFCQEGQFGVGMAPLAADHGRRILVLPKNLFRYQHLADSETAAPLYDLDGVDVIIGARSFSTPEVQVSWNFFDDGELLATGGHAPYFPTAFKADPEALAEYEQQLTEAEAAGFRIATIGEYVDWAKAQGLDQPPLPPVLDGTWQPPSTDSMHRWMGAAGLLDLAYGGESDNGVLTANVRARHRIAAAETLAAWAAEQGWAEAADLAAELEGCWREVLLAEVSDATGINPFVGEVRYGLDHARAATACADELLARLAPRVGGPLVRIDPQSGAVAAAERPAEEAREVEPLFDAADGFEVQAPGREVELRWEQVGEQAGTVRLTIAIGPPEEEGQRTAEVAFPLKLDGFYLTPGLVEDRVEFTPFSQFDFQDGRITLPLGNGLLGLDDGLWLIKQTDTVHLGATFEIGSGRVRFVDQTLDPRAGAEWVFWIVQADAQQALALADRLNLHPELWLETEAAEAGGCGCGGSSAPPLGWGILLALWALARRGRRRSVVL